MPIYIIPCQGYISLEPRVREGKESGQVSHSRLDARKKWLYIWESLTSAVDSRHNICLSGHVLREYSTI